MALKWNKIIQEVARCFEGCLINTVFLSSSLVYNSSRAIEYSKGLNDLLLKYLLTRRDFKCLSWVSLKQGGLWRKQMRRRHRDPLINIFTRAMIGVIFRGKLPMIEHVCPCLLVCVRGREIRLIYVCLPCVCTSDLIHQSRTGNSNTDKQSETNPVGSLLTPRAHWMRHWAVIGELEKWGEISVKSPCPRVRPAQINICENWCQTVASRYMYGVCVWVREQ